MFHKVACLIVGVTVAVLLLDGTVPRSQRAAAQPVPTPAPLGTLSIAGPDQVPQYRLVRLEAVNADLAAVVVWDVYPEENVDIDDRSDAVLAFTAPPGVYQVKCRTITGKTVRLARKTVAINGPAVPTDALSASLQQAFQSELPADKGKAADLAAILRHGATNGVPVATTVKQLTEAMHAAVLAGIGDALPKIRRVLGDEMNRLFPADQSTQLDAALRSQYVAQYNRLAGLLEGLK